MNHWEAMTPTERHDILQRCRDQQFEHDMRSIEDAGRWLSMPAEATALIQNLRRTRRTCISALNYPTHRAASMGCTGTGEAWVFDDPEGPYWHNGELLAPGRTCRYATGRCTAIDAVREDVRRG